MRQKLGILAIAVFVAVDVWLAALAVQHVNADPPASDVPLAPVTTTTPTSPSSPAATTSTTPTTPTTGNVPAERSDVLLGLAADGTILRAKAGDCRGEPGRVQVSTDGGKTFTTAYQPVPQVLRVLAISRTNLWFVEANEQCRPGVRRSGDAGLTWARTAGSKGTWHLTPELDSTAVHGPDGPVEVYCVATAIAPVDPTTAYVGCADGTTRLTRDAGQNWSEIAAIDGLVGLDFADENTGFALAVADCGSAVLSTTDAGESWKETACLTAKNPKAIAVNPDLSRIIVQTGRTIRVGADGGTTWEPAA